MKKIFLGVAMVSTTFAFAQKKEIAAAFKAADAGDFATAASQVAAADAIMGDKTYLLEPETLEQYLFAKGSSLLKTGKVAEGAAYLAKINDLGKSKIYAGKDANKNKVYYVGKAAADASGVQGLKEQAYVPTTSGKLGNLVNPVLQDVNKQAMDSYNAKNYAKAGEKFGELYNLLKTVGQDNKLYLYYSAVTFAQADKKDEAISQYQNLIDSGYTGVETTYTAKNKKTGQVENLDKTAYELYQKMGAAGDYSDFKTETSKSIEQELYTNYAELLVAAGKYDNALTLIEKGLKKFPTSAKLADLKGTTYYKSGKTDQFITTLKDNVAKNPKDENSWYNLGILQSKNAATLADAEASFKKVLEINPNNVNALNGLANGIYLSKADDMVENIKKAQKDKKMDMVNKLLAERREYIQKSKPYLEKWYSLEPKNADVMETLRGVYMSGGETAKAADLKAKIEALKK